MQPTPLGAEYLWQVRSVNSPESLRLRFDLPTGATLRLTSDDLVREAAAEGRAPEVPQAVEVVRDGDVIARVEPPLTIDADGITVPTSYQLDGREVIVRFPHRLRDVKYPLLVDPQVTETWYGGDWGADGWTAQEFLMGGPHPLSFARNCCGRTGLQVGAYQYASYYDGAVGQWIWQTYPNSYIARADYSGLDQMDAGNTLFTGIFSHRISNWESLQHDYGTFNGYARSHYASQDDNYAIFGIRMAGSYQRGVPGLVSMSGVTLYLGDRHPPTVSADDHSYDVGRWTDAPTAAIRVVANDVGLGLKAAGIARTDKGNPNSGPVQDDYWLSTVVNMTCQGNRRQMCPNSFDTRTSRDNQGNTFPDGRLEYRLDALPEGIHTIRATTHEISGGQYGNAVFGNAWSIKRDTSPPTTLVSGSLRDLEGKASTDSDLYQLHIEASDGQPDGAPSERRVGVGSVEVLIDGARVDYASQDCATDSCSLSLDMGIDTDTLNAGDHEVKVIARDLLGHARTVAWMITVARDEYYAGELAAWKAALERSVDRAVPILPLTRPAPSTPTTWRTLATCRASVDAVRGCFDEGKAWQREITEWLTENDALRLAVELPPMPIYGYARDKLARELTRALAGGFETARRGLASSDAAPVLISFHDPQTEEGLRALQSLLGFSTVESMRVIFEPTQTSAVESPIYGGLHDLGGDSFQAQVDALYAGQIEAATEIIDGLQRDLDAADQTTASAAGTAASIAEYQEFRSVLEQRGAIVGGIVVRADLAKLVAALPLPSTVIKAVELVADARQAADGTLGALRTDSEVVRESARETAALATDGEDVEAALLRSRGDSGRAPATYAPNLFNLRTYAENTRTSAPYLKKTYMGYKWLQRGTLDYYRGDDPHDRGYEAQGRPDSSGPLWSTNWEGESDQRGCLVTTQRSECRGVWNSNMPDAYRDDLTLDGDYKSFAIGSGNGRALRYGKGYASYYLTNKGKSATGKAVYEAQATRRARYQNPDEYVYCRGRVVTDGDADNDARCFFAEATTPIALLNLGREGVRFKTVWPR